MAPERLYTFGIFVFVFARGMLWGRQKMWMKMKAISCALLIAGISSSQIAWAEDPLTSTAPSAQLSGEAAVKVPSSPLFEVPSDTKNLDISVENLALVGDQPAQTLQKEPGFQLFWRAISPAKPRM